MRASSFSKYLRTTTLRLNDGREVAAVELSGADEAAIREAMPPPRPPMVKDPTKGSNAPRVADDTDAGYVAAFDAWYGRRSVVRLAAAVGWEPEGHAAWDRDAPVEIRAAWCSRAHAEVTACMSEAEIVRLCRAYRDFVEDAAEGVGLGNSGAGESPAPSPS
jgi:hypothetical protein